MFCSPGRRGRWLAPLAAFLVAVAGFSIGHLPREARAIVSSSGGLNINQFLGAERFYDAGYTGSRTTQANIEGGHIWNGHSTLGHITTRVTGTGALGTDDSHATRVGAAMGGRPLDTTYPDDTRAWGIAHDAETWSGAVAVSFGADNSFNTTNASVASTFAPILQTGIGGQTVDVFNASWGFNDPRGTDIRARGIDGLINANGTVGVFAAGNGGSSSNTVTSPGAGYNSITVAALAFGSAANRYNTVASFSGRGPNDFGMATSATNWTTIAGVRAVVDIAAPGQTLTLANLNAQSNPTSFATNNAGTSFAAPLVAGGASLVVDAGKDLYAGNPNAIDGRVVKAVLLNSADKTSGWNNGQLDVGGVIRTTQSLDWAVGAGRMNLNRAFDQYVTTTAGGMAGTTDLPGLGGGDVAPVGWDYGRVDSLGSNMLFIDQPIVGGTEFNTTLTWFADRNPGTLTNFSSAREQHLANLDLSVFLFDDLTNRNVIGTVAESISLYNVVEHLSFVTPATGFYGIQVNHAGTHWNFTGESNELYGLAWSATPLLVEAGDRLWTNPNGGSFATFDNWNPAQPPGPDDNAVFDLSGVYTVDFSADYTNEQLRVGNDQVTFNLVSHTYTLTSDVDFSIAVGVTSGDDARLTIADGTLSGVNAALGQATGSSGQVTVTGAGSQWHISNSLYMGGGDAAPGGAGTLSINGGAVTVDETLHVWSGGTVNLAGGQLNASTLNLTAGTLNMSGGRLAADTVIGNLTIAGGTFELGDPTSFTTIAGDYTQQAGATLELDLSGVAPGNGHTPLTITGEALLAGTLAVLPLEGLSPALDDTFQVLYADAGVFGEFQQLALPSLTDGIAWDIVYTNFAVLLQVIADLPGDFNGDGYVDAADYTIWRDGLGSAFGQEDYAAWKDNFGASAGGTGATSGSLASVNFLIAAAVPEPTSFMLLLLGSILATCRRQEQNRGKQR